jgi:hypothetical protein
MEQHKVNITTGTIIGRINRALRHRGEQLKSARGANAIQNLGHRFIVAHGTNNVVCTDVNLESLGLELGVLKPYETIAD